MRSRAVASETVAKNQIVYVSGVRGSASTIPSTASGLDGLTEKVGVATNATKITIAPASGAALLTDSDQVDGSISTRSSSSGGSASGLRQQVLASPSCITSTAGRIQEAFIGGKRAKGARSVGTLVGIAAGVAKRLRQRLVVPPSGGSNPLARP